MFGMTQILKLLADKECKQLRETIVSLQKNTDEKLEELRTYPGTGAMEPLRILALVIVLVIRKHRECFLAVLETVGAQHLEIQALNALTMLKEKVK